MFSSRASQFVDTTKKYYSQASSPLKNTQICFLEANALKPIVTEEVVLGSHDRWKKICNNLYDIQKRKGTPYESVRIQRNCSIAYSVKDQIKKLSNIPHFVKLRINNRVLNKHRSQIAMSNSLGKLPKI